MKKDRENLAQRINNLRSQSNLKMPLPKIQNSSRANNQLSRNQSIVERNIELDSLEELVQKEYMSIRDIIQMSRSELRDE